MNLRFFPVIVIIVFFLLPLVALAGCISQEAPASPTPTATPVPAAVQMPGKSLSTIEPAQMALEPSGMPGNFTLLRKIERNESMIRPWELNQGWKKGYSAAFKRDDPGRTGPQIAQFIGIFPRENVSRVVDYLIDGNFLDLARLSDAERMNNSITELPSPGIGDYSRAIAKFDKNDPDIYYLLAFSRHDVFEEIWGNGTAADYETMRQAAAIAAANIT